MENIHNAIAWYQKKIGSYDKQLWEQSVERKLQKGLPNVHHAPRKTVRLKTEYIDVDLIRGSTFTKTKPQVPWIYITRKAFVRVLFFPFYYRWWVLQSSRKVFYLLLSLYLLQTTTAFIYFSNLDGSIVEDELTLTEVVVPIGLMFLLGLIHAQTVLAHFSLKPPRRDGRHSSAGSLLPEASTPRWPTQQQAEEEAASGQLLTQGCRLRQWEPLTTRRGHRNHPRWQPPPPPSSSSSRRHHHHHHHHHQHHTASLWNIPRVEVEGTEPPPTTTATSTTHLSPSSPRKSVPQHRGARSSKRGEKKSVRIADSTHKLTPKPSPTNSATANVVSSSAGEKKTSTGKNPGLSQSDEGFRDGGERGALISETEEAAVGKHRSKDTDRSSSGIEDGFESGALYRSKSARTPPPPPPHDTTTDSDSLVSRYEIVPMHHSSLGGAKESQSSDDFTQLSHCDEKLRSLAVDDPPGKAPVMTEQSFLARSSLTEGDSTGPREEDNLSDTGHVSNSSNYNPSDSGSEAENCDDGDSVGMPVPKSPLPSSATLENPSTSLSSASLNASPRKSATQQQQRDGESSASEPSSPDARQSVSGIRRRRRTSANQNPSEQTEGARCARPLLPKLLSVRAQSKLTQTSCVSSSENEAGVLSPEGVNKATISSEEWEDRMQSDVTTSSSFSTSNSESELSENESNSREEFVEEDLVNEGLSSSAFHDINLIQAPTSTNLTSHNAQPDKVSCMIWEGNECKKLDLTALDIGWAIIDKVDNLPESSDYIFIGVALSFFLGCVPLVYRFYHAKGVSTELAFQAFRWLWSLCRKNSWGQSLIILNGFIQRLALSCIFFFLLTVTDRTFKQRLLYAKHFSYLTSSRRARKFDMPHFRLNKVRNIKIWLSLRSYLKRRGPQRSVDVIVSAAFYLSISLVCLMCIQMLKDSETYMDFLCNWELVTWCIALGIYMMRFMTLGLKINKKYRNLSVLITEQINLYLQMEQKPHKKEELILANNVLRLAENLLKELESPFKISGFSANPVIYNITKVVVLSAFSTVMTEILGFKLRLYKIKLK
ncbi:hypothetical protein ACOMHN_063566 [Nucella lapillus]